MNEVPISNSNMVLCGKIVKNIYLDNPLEYTVLAVCISVIPST